MLSSSQHNEAKAAEAKAAEATNNTFTYGNKDVRTYIINEEVWFCGRDVAELLEYKDTVNAIKDNVDADDKMVLKELIGSQHDVAPSTRSYTPNELNAYFINKAGLYSLVFGCKLEAGRQFKSYVMKTVLPSIRKLGQERYLAMVNAQLAENERLLLESKELLEQRDKELEHARSRTLDLCEKINSIQVDNPNGFIYIATNALYAAYNHYKIGRATLLNKRKSGYQTGRTKADKLGYVYFCEVSQVLLVENTIKALLAPFRDDSPTEIYTLPWPIILNFVDRVCKSFDGIVALKNEVVEMNTAYDGPAIIPTVENPSRPYSSYRLKNHHRSLNRSLDGWLDWNAAMNLYIFFCFLISTAGFVALASVRLLLCACFGALASVLLLRCSCFGALASVRLLRCACFAMHASSSIAKRALNKVYVYSI